MAVNESNFGYFLYLDQIFDEQFRERHNFACKKHLSGSFNDRETTV